MNTKFGRWKLWLAVGAAAAALGCGEQAPTEVENPAAPSAQPADASSSTPATSGSDKAPAAPVMLDKVVAGSCQQEIQAEDKTPARLLPVTEVEGNDSFLKRVLAKASPEQPTQASAPAPVPAAYIARQQQYLAQARALDAVADPAEREARKAALKQTILPVGKE